MKITAAFLILVGCFAGLSQAAVPAKNVSQKSQAARSASLSTQRKAESDKNFQRDREMVLRKKSEIEGRSNQALPTETEKKIYEEMVQAFERNDELSFQSRFQRMMMDYPRGVYADESLYLAGTMAFSNKLYGRALRHFDQVLKEYPNSNRSRAALYAKAAAYRKMNLRPQAVGVFEQVKRQYPGSPEARRAEIDLKVVR